MESLTLLQQEVLIGSLLGDGHLERRGRNACLRIQRVLTDKSYLDWEAEVFTDWLAPAGVTTRSVYDKRTGKTYHNARFNTRCHEVFTHYHDKWYVEGRKTLPTDLVLTPRIMAIWLADDGNISCYSCRRRSSRLFGKQYPHILQIKLATHSFSSDEISRLQGLLSTHFNVQSHVNHEKNGQGTIRIYRENAIRLLRLIDSSFPPLDRKAVVWRRPEARLWENDLIYVCPHCRSEHVYRNGTNSTGKRKYHCQDCNKQFINPLIIKEKLI